MNDELTIPKSHGLAFFTAVLCLGVIGFTALAEVDLFYRVAVIPARLIWLVLAEQLMVWNGSRDEGLRGLIIRRLGEIFGREFVASSPTDAGSAEISFGVEVLGRRRIERTLSIDRIESVEWSTGQATAMAGRDKKDCRVCLWFDHNDPAKSESNRKYPNCRKPDQDVWTVGPSRAKEKTAAFGLRFVAFLIAAGAEMVPGDDTTKFVHNRHVEPDDDSGSLALADEEW